MLPGMSGTELCRRLRREPATRRTPIIMLTAKASESDRVAGLDLGADDYITKPFSVRELLARVRAVMRRMDETSGKTYEDDHLLIDFDDIRVVCHGQKVKLTNKEFSCFQYWRRAPIELLLASNSSITSGVTATTAMRARWTSISGACDRSWANAAIVLKPSLASATGSLVVPGTSAKE
jgi:response regulator RpfG family c-di-GMP phosphodiesterase